MQAKLLVYLFIHGLSRHKACDTKVRTNIGQLVSALALEYIHFRTNLLRESSEGRLVALSWEYGFSFISRH